MSRAMLRWFSLPAVGLVAGCQSGADLRNTPPNVSFVAPADGAIVAAGAPVTIVAAVGDGESPDSALTLAWERSDGRPVDAPESAQDGVVEAVFPEGFPAGELRLDLVATDDGALRGGDTLTLDVRANQPPEIRWTAPAAGAALASAPPPVVEGTVVDVDTLDLRTLALTWSGTFDLANAPAAPDASGRFAFDLVDLPVGEHQVTLTVRDYFGASDVHTATFSMFEGDGDGDGSPASEDCDDTDPARYPDATEIVGDGIDQNCDGVESCFVDNDGDGYRPIGEATVASADLDCADAGEAARAASMGDCDDAAAAIHPGAVEGVGDGVDQNCDGTERCFLDNDDDGYRADATAGVASADLDCADAREAVAADATGDCDDENDSVNPAAPEVCNAIDDDCDAAVDEGVRATYFRDADGDGFGLASVSTLACSPPLAYVSNDDDCDDARAALFPGATELPGDSVDQNCDGLETCFDDDDGDGYLDASEDVRASTDMDCADAFEGTVGDPRSDCDDASAAVHPGATELPGDGVDQNCDTVELCFFDLDSDGFRAAGTATRVSTDLDCADAGEGTSLEPATDCADRDAAVKPGATEVCNGVDDNCSGVVDEGVTTTFYRDADGDGHGWLASPSTPACTAPAGFVGNSTDCNDTTAAVRPGATEVVGDGLDQNCDSKEVCFEDDDNDGFLDTSGDTRESTTDTDCADANEGTLADFTTDCNDTNASIFPGATETIGDGVDQNCDTQEVCFRDADDDGVRPNSTATVVSSNLTCTDAGEAVSSDGTNDCNDADASVRPGATETVGDGIDQDCNGGEVCFHDVDNDGYLENRTKTVVSPNVSCTEANEGTLTDPLGDCNDSVAAISPAATEVPGEGIDQDCDTVELCFLDLDSDGFRAAGTATRVSTDLDCADAGEGTSLEPATDCADRDAAVKPGATEVCNGLDDNCSGVVDEGVTTTFYRDADGDGHGWLASPSTPACIAPAGFVGNSTDCNDTTAAIRPGATEVVGDGLDQNCDSKEVCFEDDDNDGFLDTSGDTRESTTDTDCADANEGTLADLTTDCNDMNAAVFPGATETIGDGVDQNCDTQEVCFRDADDDGVRPNSTATVVSSNLTCTDAGEAVSSDGTNDCNDADAAVRPGATETAGDGVDQDCNGGEVCFHDVDNDGYLENRTKTVVSPNVSCTEANEGTLTDPLGDCNDSVGAISPAATEQPGDGVDQDCDTVELCFFDLDSDGFRAAGTATRVSTDLDCADAGEGTSSEPATDCADRDAAVRPGATEVCNGLDDNCSGMVDEGVTTTFYRDADGDGHGWLTSPSTPACTAPAGFVGNSSDCNDTTAAIRPGVAEVVGDGVDQNCDNKEMCFEDDDNDGFLDTSGDTRESTTDTDCADANEGSLADLTTDCNDTASGSSIYPGATEVIGDGVDQNCDTQEVCFRDADDDGRRPNPGATVVSADLDCGDSGEAVSGDPTNDCNDQIATIYGGATEIVGDGIDQDCDGGELCRLDQDNDGYLSGSGATVASPDLDCLDFGEGLTGDPGGDCADANAARNPGANEACNAVDDDCDGLVDEGVLKTFYRDADADSFGAALVTTAACAVPSGYVTNDDDCNDGSNAIKPGATEGIADGVDQNCDGREWCYPDVDSDGHRVAGGAAVLSDDLDCIDGGEGITAEPADDCDDTLASVYPGATEVIGDGVDQNCDGDELCFHDDDGDGYLDATGDTIVSDDIDCWDANEGYAGQATSDCADTDADRRPGAPERCNAVDDDCDGAIDENTLPTTRYVPTPYATIQAAIDASCDGDRVYVSPGTYHETIDYRGKNLDVVGVAGAGSTTIDGDAAGSVVTISRGTLRGFRITDGDATRGGGIRIANVAPGPLVLEALDVAAHVAANDGGGLYGALGASTQLTVTNSRFGENVANNGGGIYLSGGGYVELERLLIEGNGDAPDSGMGGGMFLNGAGFYVADVLVRDNVSGWAGGAYLSGPADGNSVWTGGEFVGNVGGMAPAVFARGWELSRLDVHENVGVSSASRAVWFHTGSASGYTTTLRNSRIYGNSHAGLWLYFSAASTNFVIENNTIVENGGEGILCLFESGGGSLTVRNTISAYNQTYGIWSLYPGCPASVTYSDLFGNIGGAVAGLPNPVGTNGNTSENPLFVSYGPAPAPSAWDLHLKPNSPVRDAGDPALLDYDGSRSAMGAYGGPDADFSYLPYSHPDDAAYFAYEGDGDADGMYDGWEWRVGLRPGVSDGSEDPDGDGWTNLNEFIAGTDPLDPDTDGDGNADSTDPTPLG